MGIFGGNNIEFIKSYTKFGLDFLNKNYKFLKLCLNVNLDIIFEQYFLSILAIKHYIPIKCLLEKQTMDHTFPHLTNFSGLPDQCNFVHIMGGKKYPTTCEQLEQRVKIDYPEQYERVIQTLRDFSKKSYTFPNWAKSETQNYPAYIDVSF